MPIVLYVWQLQEASRPVAGDFSITIGDTSLRFPHDVTAEQLENLLSAQLPEEGGMYVGRHESIQHSLPNLMAAIRFLNNQVLTNQ